MSTIRNVLATLAGRPASTHAAVPSLLQLQDRSPEWEAEFAWTPQRGGPGLSVRLFRCEFDVLTTGDRPFVVHVSADSRYRLWLNGQRVGFGPAKGTLARYYFETYDLAPLLRTGKNVLAAEVRWFGVNSPGSEVHSPVPGWLLQGPKGADVNTPGRWQAFEDRAVTADTTDYIDNANEFINHLERVDFAQEPSGWREVDFAATGWIPAVSTGRAAAVAARWGVTAMRSLTPRDVPALSETPARFVRTIEDRTERSHRFGAAPAGWSLAAGQGGVVLLDAGQYATGFPELEFAGGRGREVRILYAEALGQWVTEKGVRVWRKGEQRDDFRRFEPHGYRDTLLLRGGEQTWEPFYWRSFRFVQLEVLPGPEPLQVKDARYRLTVHPQQFAASFSSDDPQARSLFEVSVRTFQVGAHEIYDDSPYYEQFSYIADTRIEALGSMHLCNNPALPRRTIQLYLDTVRADGLVDSRVPCQYERQTIPYFCLYWIFMVEDYWRWVGQDDATFVRGCLPVVDTILSFFRARLREDGFVGPTGGWNMVDDVEEWPDGEPPAVTAGGSTYLSSLYVEALQTGARLHGQAGEPGDSLRWMSLSDRMTGMIRRAAWDEAAGLFRESPNQSSGRFSQHAQAAAINAGIATPAQIRRIVERLCRDGDLIPARSMQAFYVARALEHAGRYDQVHQHLLDAWRVLLGRRVTTWPEYPDPARSDAHAWAAWPAVEFVRTVLGIRPAAPGWTAVRIAPQVGGLGRAEGQAPTPRGPVHVAWSKSGSHLRLSAQAPHDVMVHLALPGQPVRKIPTGGEIEAEIALPNDGAV